MGRFSRLETDDPRRGGGGVAILSEEPQSEFTEEAGTTRWYFYDLDKTILREEPQEIIACIRSNTDTPRHTEIPEKNLVELRSLVEKHIKNTYLKRINAPVGVNPVLMAWMEVN